MNYIPGEGHDNHQYKFKVGRSRAPRYLDPLRLQQVQLVLLDPYASPLSFPFLNQVDALAVEEVVLFVQQVGLFEGHLVFAHRSHNTQFVGFILCEASDAQSLGVFHPFVDLSLELRFYLLLHLEWV